MNLPIRYFEWETTFCDEWWKWYPKRLYFCQTLRFLPHFWAILRLVCNHKAINAHWNTQFSLDIQFRRFFFHFNSRFSNKWFFPFFLSFVQCTNEFAAVALSSVVCYCRVILVAPLIESVFIHCPYCKCICVCMCGCVRMSTSMK